MVYFTMDDVLFCIEGAKTCKDSADLCMIQFNDCYIEIYTFYLFKQMELGHNDYANEMLQDPNDFDKYMPLFT